MSYGERDSYDALVTKLQNICEENGLICKIVRTSYPFAVIVSPDQSMNAQISMLDNETGYNGKNAKWVFMFPNGELENKTIDDFTLSDGLLNKLRNISKKIYVQWCKVCYRESIENKRIYADADTEPEQEAEQPNEPEYAEL